MLCELEEMLTQTFHNFNQLLVDKLKDPLCQKIQSLTHWQLFLCFIVRLSI